MTLLAWLLVLLGSIQEGQGQNYSQTLAIFKERLDPLVYNPQVPPQINQAEIMYVLVGFELLSIVEVGDVAQSFVCNGVVPFIWTDQLLRWDPADYRGKDTVHPETKQIWTPRVWLLNTLGERDIFSEDKSTIIANSNGTITWLPGSLFATSCELDMTNYPFDEQTCYINMISMSYTVSELLFVRFDKIVRTTFYSKSGEWDFLGGAVDTSLLDTQSEAQILSNVQISFHIRRNPKIIIISTVLPIVFLSFMNLLVFFIPAESGEKVSYGMAVLLSLSVFMSVVSGMLPKSSDAVPRLTVYLFSLLVVSLLTVIDTVIIVFLHHLQEKEEKHQRVTEKIRGAAKKVSNIRKVVSAFSRSSKESAAFDDISPQNSSPGVSNNDISQDSLGAAEPKVNRYTVIGKYIDCVSFGIFLITWLTLTLGFMLPMALS